MTPSFRNPDAAQAGGYVLALAGLLVAVELLFHQRFTNILNERTERWSR